MTYMNVRPILLYCVQQRMLQFCVGDCQRIIAVYSAKDVANYTGPILGQFHGTACYGTLFVRSCGPPGVPMACTIKEKKGNKVKMLEAMMCGGIGQHGAAFFLP